MEDYVSCGRGVQFFFQDTNAAVRPERARALRKRGLSIRQIAYETGVSAMTVQRILASETPTE